jgi:hypothetical protein
LTQGSAPSNTIDAILADNNDNSYVTNPSSNTAVNFEIGFGPYALPANATLQYLTIQYRATGTDPNTLGRNFETVQLIDTTTSTVLATVTNNNIVHAASPGSGVGGPYGFTYSGALSPAQLNQLALVFQNVEAGVSIYKVSIIVTYYLPPTATPTAPTGTVTTTAVPQAAWTYSDPEGGSEASAQVAFFTQAQYQAPGFDAASSPATERVTVGAGVTTYTPTVLQMNGVWRVYTRATSALSGLTGSWAHSQYTISLAAPPAPLLAVGADLANGRTRLTVTPTGGDVPTNYTVQRSDDGGVTWRFVRGLNLAPVLVGGGANVAYDYECPRSATKPQTQYRAQVVDTLAGPILVPGPYSTVTKYTQPSDGLTWLKSVSNPALNTGLCQVVGMGDKGDAAVTVFNPINRQFPVVHIGALRASTITVTLFFPNDTAWEAWLALRAARDTLLLQTLYGDDEMEQFYGRLSAQPTTVRTTTNDQNTSQFRTVSFDFYQVAVP